MTGGRIVPSYYGNAEPWTPPPGGIVPSWMFVLLVPLFFVAELIPPCILRKYARGYVTKRSREPPMYPVSPPHSATAFNKSFSVAQEKPNMSEDCRTIYLVETPKQQ